MISYIMLRQEINEKLDTINKALECLLKTIALTQPIISTEKEYKDLIEKRDKYIQSTIKLLNENLTKE